MRTRVIRRVVLIGLATLTLTGCGRQVATAPEGDGLLAIGPEQTTLAAARPEYILSAIEAGGGLPTWMQCKRLDFRAIVAAYRPEGSYYLTEQTFAVFPWSDAVRISAQEPRSAFVWLLVRGRFEQVKGNAALDVSPLAGGYQDYASAVLQIITVPARLLDRTTQLSRQPLGVQIRGQQYDPIDARFGERKEAVGDKIETSSPAETYWTKGIYYQNRHTSLVDMVWLANPARQDFVIVRGYDYTAAAQTGVLIPTKIEVFRSDSEARIGQRFAKIDLAM
jgi:hypothetical protein